MDDGFKRAAVLQGERCENCRIVRQDVEQGFGAIGIQKNLANAAVGKISDRHLILRTIALKGECDGRSPVRQAVASRCVARREVLLYCHLADLRIADPETTMPTPFARGSASAFYAASDGLSPSTSTKLAYSMRRRL